MLDKDYIIPYLIWVIASHKQNSCNSSLSTVFQIIMLGKKGFHLNKGNVYLAIKLIMTFLQLTQSRYNVDLMALFKMLNSYLIPLFLLLNDKLFSIMINIMDC